MDFFCGLMKLKICFGMPDIPDIYIWVNSRHCGKAYVS